MQQTKTTVGALLDRFEKGEIELTEMEVQSFKSMPRPTAIYGFEVKPKLKDRFAALGGAVPTKAQPKMSSSNARFQKRSAVYKCVSCGKMTRETGQGESSTQSCAYCYLLGGEENLLQDGGCTQAEFDECKAALDKHYGRTS